MKNALREVTVRARFYLVMSLVGGSLLTMASWGAWSNRSDMAIVDTLFERTHTNAQAVGKLRESLSSVRRYESAMIAVSVSNPTDVERFAESWKQELRQLEGHGQSLAQADSASTDVAELVATQQQLIATYREAIGPVAQQLQEARIDASVALAYAQRASGTLEALHANALRLTQVKQEAFEHSRKQLIEASSAAAMLRLGIVGAALALVLPLLWLTLRSVCNPLDDAVAVANRIASGDLTAPVAVEGRDEPARLMQALLNMQTGLRDLVGQVRRTSLNVQAAATDVAQGNADLSQRTEFAATRLQEAATNVSQLAVTVRGCAETTRTADQLASSAAEVASRGGAAVGQVVSTMDEISAASRRIADIIGVIDGIAFQTNILALNAAVEAARAGEQGRGFAVVATEVRSLAQRSAEAAKEVRGLIDTSEGKVASGSRQVAAAGATISEVVASAHRVSSMIAEVTSSTSAQSQGIDTLHTAVGQLDEMTRRNAALVDQSAAAAESLQAQASQLAAIVSTFKLDPHDVPGSSLTHQTSQVVAIHDPQQDHGEVITCAHTQLIAA